MTIFFSTNIICDELCGSGSELFVRRKVSRSVSIPPILEGDTDIGEMEDEEDREGERRKR